ncbi:MAG TPA: C1 family peptidase [Chitinophagaceae bacterium]|jgi:hypothetical protein|nr:C1 family peptidase [Chitinophagaceae bacterium]
MKRLTKPTLAVSLALVLFGCSKNNSENLPAGVQTPEPHAYGVLPMQPEQWSFVPEFSTDIILENARTSGLPVKTLPASYLLASPTIRNQGQIGSCTAFCGTETNEILNYYKTHSTTYTSLTVGTGLTTASTTQLVNSSLFGPSLALSPLFIYYVERCVVMKQPITADGGAYMVAIPQTLQGLTNNRGTGTPLTLTINNAKYTFGGACYENLYPYPSTGSHSSTQYTTPPAATAISNAVNFKIGIQSGTTGSSGTTSHGYFVINSTDPVADAKTAIAYNKPVMMGFNVYDNSSYQYFEGLSTRSGKYIYNPLNADGTLVSGLKLLGGHAVPLIGYIDDATQPGGGVFIVQNSWGTGWGYKGYFYMPYSVLRSKTIVSSGSLYVAII